MRDEVSEAKLETAGGGYFNSSPGTYKAGERLQKPQEMSASGQWCQHLTDGVNIYS